MPDVILVDEQDNQIGTQEKQQAHLEGKLHRAFSVFLFNSKGELLLQRRALEKYHSGGLWTNSCCSHPAPGEGNKEAAKRRVAEELGIHCKVEEIFTFTYKVALDKGVTEHEFLHVFVGNTDETPKPDPAEIMDYQWISPDKLTEGVTEHPELYTYWMKQIWQKVLDHRKTPR